MSDISTERVVLCALLKDTDFAQKFLPTVKAEYFADTSEQRILKRIVDFFDRFGKPPEKASLIVDVKTDRGLSESQSERDLQVVNDISSIVLPDSAEWVADTYKAWAKRQSVFNALRESISIHEGESDLSVDVIPDILMAAINVDFDLDCGLSYSEDIQRRWDYYHTEENRIQFEIDILNQITRGGVARKTLNLFAGGTNIGKSFGLCSLAAGYIRAGYDVLYVSCEMSEDEIAGRIDQNMMRLDQDGLRDLKFDDFSSRIEELKRVGHGELRIKEFPTGEATALDIKRTLDEMRLRKNFVPTVVICDYLTIMSSYRSHAKIGSYEFYKQVAAELRALAKKMNIVMWSAVQFNRAGMDATDAGIADLAESAAIAHVADFILALFRSEELDLVNQIAAKQLKNRYAKMALRPKFALGADIDQQRLFDADQDSPSGVIETAQRRTNDQIKNRFMGFK